MGVRIVLVLVLVLEFEGKSGIEDEDEDDPGRLCSCPTLLIPPSRHEYPNALKNGSSFAMWGSICFA